MLNISSVALLDSVTATGAGAKHEPRNNKRTFQAFGATSAGAGAATIKVQASLDGTNWLDIGEITLTLATTASNDGFASDAPWRYIRGNVTAISGTGATVSLYMGA